MQKMKYKVLAADDEYWSRENLRSLISWEDYAIKFLDPACDGEEVLERIKEENLSLQAEMASLLREYRRECAWETEAYDGRALEDGDFLFRRKGCRLPMTPSTFTWRFKLILKKHGLPSALNVHSLRHTNASLLIAGGADVATVAGLLGHSQPSTTLDIYTHAFDKNKKAASQVLQEGLEI